jgi:hypothetical protein
MERGGGDSFNLLALFLLRFHVFVELLDQLFKSSLYFFEGQGISIETLCL